MFDIIILPPDQWHLYRQIRLELLQQEAQAFGSSYAVTAQRPESYWRERLEAAQAGEDSWLLFAREGDRLVGMIGAHLEDDGVPEIVSVYVARDRRGQGIGAALMEAILAELEKKGNFHRARLSVSADQTAAVALYQRYGFAVVRREPGVAGDGSAHIELTMEKEW